MGYDGNQLASVSDGSTFEPAMGYVKGDHNGGYGYDSNGNMITMGNNSIQIGYNFLNLPSTKGVIGESSGSPAWTYTADGVKLKSDTREYVDGIEYDNGELHAIHHAEGRVYPDKQTDDEIANNDPKEWKNQFYIRDHLGSTRLVLTQNGATIQEDNYYPFGMKQNFIDQVEDDDKRDTRFLYNGKEINTDLKWLDYGARFYDPSISLWTSVDPLTEKMPQWSPYNYTFNNPVRYTDPDGRAPSEDPPGALETFLSDWGEEGLIKATSNYFNFSSAVTGTRQDIERTKSRVDHAEKRLNKGLDETVIALQSVQDKADKTQYAALGTTAVSGGASAPVTVPVAVGAEIVGDAALFAEICIDYCRDGQLDNNSVTQIITKAVIGKAGGELIDRGVDALNIGGKNAGETIEAVKAVSGSVNNLIESTTTSKLNIEL